MTVVWRAGICWLLIGWGAFAQSLVQRVPTRTTAGNPLQGNETARRAGAKLYARECSACHGKNREGIGKAPALGQSEVQAAQAGVLFWILRNGSLYRGMPSFAHLPDAQRWQIITFLQAPAP